MKAGKEVGIGFLTVIGYNYQIKEFLTIWKNTAILTGK